SAVAADRHRLPRDRPPRPRRGTRDRRPRLGPPAVAGPPPPLPPGTDGRRARPRLPGLRADLRRAASHLRRSRLAEQRRRPAPRGDLRPRLRLRLPGDRALPPYRGGEDLEDAPGARHPPHPRRGAGGHPRRRALLLRFHGRGRGPRNLAGLHPARRVGRGGLRRGLPRLPAAGTGGRPALRPDGRAAHRAPTPETARRLRDAPRAGPRAARGAVDAGGPGGGMTPLHVAVVGAGAFGGWTALHLLR